MPFPLSLCSCQNTSLEQLFVQSEVVYTIVYPCSFVAFVFSSVLTPSSKIILENFMNWARRKATRKKRDKAYTRRSQK